jgi:hypothetical protein
VFDKVSKKFSISFKESIQESFPVLLVPIIVKKLTFAVKLLKPQLGFFDTDYT